MSDLATLDAVERKEKRFRRGLGTVLLLLAVLLPALLYDMAVPASAVKKSGTVLTFEITATDAVFRTDAAVRLDDGTTVWARNGTGRATPVGARVELWEASGSITGYRRYWISRISRSERAADAEAP